MNIECLILLPMSLYFLFYWRPETKLFSLLLITVFTIIFLGGYNYLFLIIILLICIYIYMYASFLEKKIMPASFKNLSLYYMHYSSKFKSFKPLHNDIHKLILQMNFLDDTAKNKTLINNNIIDEIKKRKYAFFKWLLLCFLNRNLTISLHAVTLFSIKKYSIALTLTLHFICIMSIYLTASPILYMFGIVAYLFIFIIPIFNAYIAERHLFIFSSLLLSAMIIVFFNTFLIISYSNLICLLFALCFICNIYKLIKIREKYKNNIYFDIANIISSITQKNDLIFSSYPQLLNALTERPCIGSFQILESLDLIINKYKPKFILIDNIRGKTNNYFLYTQNTLCIPGYITIYNSKEKQFLILKLKNL